MSGDIEFYVMRIGYQECDLAWLVANARPATVNSPNRAAAWVQIPVVSFLIKHPQGLSLFDTGCAANGMEYWPDNTRKIFPYTLPEEERLENRLAVLGIKPMDIDIVVVSHLHFDHVGNISLFPKSRIIVHAQELATALLETHADPNYVGGYVKREFDIEGLRYELIEEDTELLPGVEVVTLPGHTSGLLGLVVHLKNSGTIICTSDAVYTKENYGPPIHLSAVIYDSLSAKQSIKKIQKLQKRYNAFVIFGHDREQHEKKVKKFPECYA